MMTPQDVLQTGTQRTIAPRTHPYSPKIDGTRTPRDERRRAQHNEVERRRRDKINNWIVQLSKIIPDCNADNSKTGASKGGILSKACDYIRELRQTNQRMQETFKEAERLQMDNELLRQQVGARAEGWVGARDLRARSQARRPCHLCLPDRGAEERERPASSPAAAAQPGDGGRQHPAVTPTPPCSRRRPLLPPPQPLAQRGTHAPPPAAFFYSRFLTKTGRNNAFLWIPCPPPSSTWKRCPSSLSVCLSPFSGPHQAPALLAVSSGGARAEDRGPAISRCLLGLQRH
ncbi:upstream stimulatory factor 2 isoform X1 [Carlito syrichta]|uniref:Upstream stimulatory factor 2 n=1 Tax=Carlito syrichta TaxID=1868482 RepID=A0A3Q0DL20_CARSF|nr:upstream stimulatory factor 2 isoform X1 [Carlito syrichta]